MDHQHHVSSFYFFSVEGLSHILDSTCMTNTGYTSVVTASDCILCSRGQGCHPERARQAGRMGYQEHCEIHQGQR